MKKYAGEEFLNKIYKDLVNSDIVKHTGNGGNKNEDVHIYMDRLEHITERALKYEKILLLKKFYYDKYVIKPENIPDTYYKQQEQILLDRGYGHLEYGYEARMEIQRQIIEEQKETLDYWIDYFASNETQNYPTWFKYFCFQGMLKIGYFDKGEHKFTKRTSSTVNPFIEINREAIALIYDELLKLFNKEELTDLEMKKLLEGGGFSKIYAYAIRKIDTVKRDNCDSNEGIWKKYNQGSNPEVLFNDIHGKGTGWCTAGGLETAKFHIENGDFYVYFTKDSNNEFTNPRLAIRMNGRTKIEEARGIAEGQNIEQEMESVLKQKLEEFPDRQNYDKKVNDMIVLTNIYNKYENNEELTIDELRFVYEIDSKIMGFGYKKDPRITEIIKDRNIRTDLANIFNCSENQVSLTREEALSGDAIVHYGNLNLSDLKSAKGIVLPNVIVGNVSLFSLETTEGLTFPKMINGKLDFFYLERADHTKLPDIINGDLNFVLLKKAEGLILPNEINGNLVFNMLESINEITLPKKINGDFAMYGIKNIENLILPTEVNGSVAFPNLRCTQNLVLPNIVNGNLNLWSLLDGKNITMPSIINGRFICKLVNDDIDEFKNRFQNRQK